MAVRQHYSFLRILTGSDLSKRRIPVMTISGSADGPLVWLTGCMHGDEIGGTVIIHELFKKLRKRLLRGSVVAFPLMNPFGFETISRNIAISKEDLNRAFPGNDKGTLAQRIAHKVFTEIVESGPALVIDLHNDWNKSIPYVLFDPPGSTAVDKSILAFARTTGLLQIEDTDGIRSSLTYSLMRRDIPALVLEMGESHIINEKNIEIGIRAIWNILVSMELVNGDEDTFEYPLPSLARDKVLLYSARPYSSTSGIVRFLKQPGDVVHQGDKIARVYNAFGKQTEVIRAQADGIVIGHSDTALSFPGAPVMAFGILK